MCPGRSNTGPTPRPSRDTSTMVDSMPTSDGPPSSTNNWSVPNSGNSVRTCAACVGETCPNLLADGAATPPCPLGFWRANSRSKAWATGCDGQRSRSEEHTSELQSLMRISYAVFCLKKKNQNIDDTTLKQHRTSILYTL